MAGGEKCFEILTDLLTEDPLTGWLDSIDGHPTTRAGSLKRTLHTECLSELVQHLLLLVRNWDRLVEQAACLWQTLNNYESFVWPIAP